MRVGVAGQATRAVVHRLAWPMHDRTGLLAFGPGGVSPAQVGSDAVRHERPSACEWDRGKLGLGPRGDGEAADYLTTFVSNRYR